eukprot:6183503-Prymnesium_polylepis.1
MTVFRNRIYITPAWHTTVYTSLGTASRNATAWTRVTRAMIKRGGPAAPLHSLGGGVGVGG